MSERFYKVIERMPLLLDRLRESPLRTRNNLPNMSERGVYVLYENEEPIYVGRSNRLKKRLLEHSRPSSTHNSASFAFNLAREAAPRQGVVVEGKSRSVVEAEPKFKELFTQAKQRVASMRIRTVKIIDPIEQTIFEVYAALALKTPYNDFDNY